MPELLHGRMLELQGELSYGWKSVTGSVQHFVSWFWSAQGCCVELGGEFSTKGEECHGPLRRESWFGYEARRERAEPGWQQARVSCPTWLWSLEVVGNRIVRSAGYALGVLVVLQVCWLAGCT